MFKGKKIKMFRKRGRNQTLSNCNGSELMQTIEDIGEIKDEIEVVHGRHYWLKRIFFAVSGILFIFLLSGVSSLMFLTWWIRVASGIGAQIII